MRALNKILTYAGMLLIPLYLNTVHAVSNHEQIYTDKEELANYLSTHYQNEPETRSVNAFAVNVLSNLGCANFNDSFWSEGKRLSLSAAEQFKDPHKIEFYYKDAAKNMYGEEFEKKGSRLMSLLAKAHMLFGVEAEREYLSNNQSIEAFLADIQKRKGDEYTWKERNFVSEFYSIANKINLETKKLNIPCDKKLKKPTEQISSEKRAMWGENKDKSI
jgi:hypothetical protein